MYTKYLTVGEVYATIPEEAAIAEFFELGIKLTSDRLAVSALEELIRRGALDRIIAVLDWAFSCNNMLAQPNTVSFIASTLRDSCRGLDPLLCKYGSYLLIGEYVGPSKWLQENVDDISNALRCNAKPWAKKYFDLAPFSSFGVDDYDPHALPGNDR